MEACGRSGNAIVREYLIEWMVMLNTRRRSHSGIFLKGIDKKRNEEETLLIQIQEVFVRQNGL